MRTVSPSTPTAPKKPTLPVPSRIWPPAISRSNTVRTPRDEATRAGRPDILAILDDHLTAQGHRLWHAPHLLAFVERVVDLAVKCRPGHRHLGIRVPDDEVAVTADRDRSFVGVEAECFGCRRRDEIDKTIQAQFALVYALVGEHHAFLDARCAIWDPGEILRAQVLLAVEVVRAVV